MMKKNYIAMMSTATLKNLLNNAATTSEEKEAIKEILSSREKALEDCERRELVATDFYNIMVNGNIEIRNVKSCDVRNSLKAMKGALESKGYKEQSSLCSGSTQAIIMFNIKTFEAVALCAAFSHRELV